MKSFFRTMLAVIVGHAILAGLLIIVIAGAVMSRLDDKVDVKDGTALVMTLDGAIPESDPVGGFSMPWSPRALSHAMILENLEKARHDGRIGAVVLRIGSPGIGFAKMDEIREQVAMLRDADKPVWVYTEMMGLGALYLGSACDRILMMKHGFCSLEGFSSERLFLAGTLEKLGIEQNLHRIEGYKSAAEAFQRKDMSPTSRENAEWMMDEFYGGFVRTVEEGRRLGAGFLEGEVFALGVLTPAEAHEMGLADELVYWDEVEGMLLELDGIAEMKKRRTDTELRALPQTVSGEEYAKVSRKDAGIKGRKKIAVVHATGLIQGEESGMSFPFGVTMGSATIAEAFRDAVRDKDVAGVVFRIDSGGGESHTSWKIQRAALEASRIKPMVVSMCDVAGSGGYMICYPLPNIVANRNSVVGSIGSISGKFNMRGLYDKVGVTKDFVRRGSMAGMWSDYSGFTDEQWASFKERHWADYFEWVDDVAETRGMTREQIDGVARGRVWTGEQALEHGLIDELGSFYHAVSRLKEQAGIPEDEEVEYVRFPRKKSPMEALKSGGFAAMLFSAWDHLAGPLRSHATWVVDWNTYR